MTLPVYVDGQVLDASDCNNYFMPSVVIKGSDTGRASTTSVSADPDLVIAVVANATYMVQGVIFYDGGTGGSEGDIKWSFSTPSGASGQYSVAHQNLSASYVGAFASNWTDTVTGSTSGIGTILVLTISGMLAIASTAGNLTFNWAQNTSMSTNTHVKAQSFLTLQRIA